MGESYTIKLIKEQWLPTSRDGKDYQLSYSYLINSPEKISITSFGSITVGISGTLIALWNLNNDDLKKVLFEYAKRELKKKAEEKTLGGNSEIQLTSYNSTQQCPYDPNSISVDFNRPLTVDSPKQNPIAISEPASLASAIIDLRDSINAIFGERFKNGRLLDLPQERHLIEFFKECRDHETFAYKVASIGGLSTAIKTSDLNKYVSKKDKSKPLDILGAFLRTQYPEAKVQVDKIMEVLIN